MESEEYIGKIFFKGNKKSKREYEKVLHNALEITF